MAERADVGILPRLARPEVGSAATAPTLLRAAGMLALVCLAEILFLLTGLLGGAVAAMATLSVLLILGALQRGRPDGQMAIALCVVPVLRILSIAIPSVLVPRWVWYAEVGIPVIVATGLAARMIGMTATDLGLRRVAVPETPFAVAGGLALGYILVRLIEPVSILSDRSVLTAGLATAAVIVGAAAEELLFRGLLLRVEERILPGSGVLVTSGLSTLFYVATLNARYVALMGLLSLVFAILTRRSGSIWPALACHAMVAWSQLILWPALLG